MLHHEASTSILMDQAFAFHVLGTPVRRLLTCVRPRLFALSLKSLFWVVIIGRQIDFIILNFIFLTPAPPFSLTNFLPLLLLHLVYHRVKLLRWSLALS